MAAHAFVLHLTRARKRRENAHALLAACGLPGEIWAAVDGAALEPADLASDVRTHLFDPPYPFDLGTGEIGCFLSHRQIWAEIVRRGLDHALVLEDDVTLDPDIFPRALALGTRHVATYGYVQLQDRPPKGSARLVDTNGPCKLTLPVLAPLRTSAQLVSRGAAERLLQGSDTFDRPVDTFIQSHWHTGLRPGVIFPAGISTISNSLDGSTIQASSGSRSGKFRREVARLLYRRRVARLSRGSEAPIPEARS